MIFGHATGFADIDLATLTAAQGFRIFGADAVDLSGESVSSAGDVNGDGFDDLIVGARSADAAGNVRSDAGESTVIFGGDFIGGVVFAGTAAADTFTGTAAAETFVGGQGDDTLIGNGGADSFQGGAGNDTITASDLNFLKVDGGSGTDTLVLLGSGQTFDFTTLSDNKVADIEAIDITGSGNNTLKLGMTDVFNISDMENFNFSAAASHNSLVVQGDTGDTLELHNFDPDGGGPLPASVWQLAASGVGLDGSAGGAFNVYDLVQAGSPQASVAVDTHLNVLLV